jgi:hypothetical protein
MQRFQHNKEGRKNKKPQLCKPVISLPLEKPYRMVKF